MSKPGDLVNGFDLLLKRNIQHIWEKIFLSLDYASFKNCLKVSKAWNEVFERESFVTKVKSAYAADMWMDPQNLKRQVWKAKKTIRAWTASSDEVAYVEKTHQSLVISFIDRDGELRSGNISMNFEETDPTTTRTVDDVDVENIWILQHVIIIKSDVNIIAFDKQGLKQNTISLQEDLLADNELLEEESMHFDPSFGLRFLSFILMDEDNPDLDNGMHARFSLREVPFDSDGKDKLEVFSTTNDPHIYYCRGAPHDDGQPERVKTSFSEEGSHFICWDDENYGGVNVYSIEGESSGLEIRHLWDKYEYVKGAKANKKYVAYLTPDYAPDASSRGCRSTNFLMVRDIGNGEKICSHELWPNRLGTSDLEIDNRCRIMFLTKKHIFSVFSYTNGHVKKDALLIADLCTHEARRSIGKETALNCRQPQRLAAIINESKTAMYTYDLPGPGQLILMNLTSYDPETVLNGAKTITSRATINDGRWAWAYSIENFMEIKQGLCICQVKDFSSSDSREDFIVEVLAWKSETLPKALKAWSSIVHDHGQ